jgi:methionyl-tRNA formyltransferase
MQMDPGMDTGPMLATARLPIEPEDTGGSLTERLAQLGADLLRAQLAALLSGALTPVSQDEALATLAPKLTRADALLDLHTSAQALHDRVRAFQPWPGALLPLGKGHLKILRTEVDPTPTAAAPGTVLAASRQGLTLATGAGALRLLEVQPEGKRRMAAGDFLAGHPLTIGGLVQ